MALDKGTEDLTKLRFPRNPRGFGFSPSLAKPPVSPDPQITPWDQLLLFMD